MKYSVTESKQCGLMLPTFLFVQDKFSVSKQAEWTFCAFDQADSRIFSSD